MPSLFDNDDSDSDKEIKVNTDYAKSYENFRKKEEINKLKTKYGIDPNEIDNLDEGSESNSSSSEEDNEGNEVNEQFDKEFYRTLAYLKKKDPSIYNEKVRFFNAVDDKTKDGKEQKGQKEKAIYLRDYERKIIVERGGKFSDSEDEDKQQQKKNPTYTEEQQLLKESFKKVLDEDQDEDPDLLKPKEKSEIERQQEEAAYKEWLKGQQKDIDPKEQEEFKPLRDFWNDPNLDPNEKFLRDYILNNKYLEKESLNQDLSYNDVVHDSDDNLSDDEEEINKQEEFEHKYNFRFEEPDQEFIKRYPRTIENSLRRKDTRRAQKREQLKKKKQEEKLRRQEELKQLKALKRKEIQEKIEKLKEITGNDDIDFNDADLEDDFDPAEHDRKMEQIFNESYYAAPAEDVKPEFPDIDEELEIEKTWDDFDPTTDCIGNNNNDYNNEGPHCEDPNFNMDADYDEKQQTQEVLISTNKKKRRRRSKFAEIIAKEKPKFDSTKYRSYQEYFDQYYSLDYEDMIGDLPCRFKYRKVVPNDYGLTIEEILMADDKELNKWCSLKKALQYKPEHAELNDVKVYQRKAKDEALKRKILKSLYTSPEEEESVNTNTENENTKKKRRRKKKQTVLNNNNDNSVEINVSQSDVGSNNFINSENTETQGEKEIVNSSETIKKDKNASITRNKIKKRKRKPENHFDNTKNKKLKWSNNKSENSQMIEQNVIGRPNSKTEDINNLDQNKISPNLGSDNKSFKKNQNSKKKGKKMKGKNFNKEIDQISKLDPVRLKMYGINAKKLKNKLKYGNKKT